MKIKSVRESVRAEAFDMTVCGTHTFVLANNTVCHNCDTRCMGRTCGVCSPKDLQIRRGYIQGAANELDVDLSNVDVIDQKSQAMRVRAKVYKSAEKRFVMNDHFRYALRRAAYRAGVPVAKRTFKFATDNVRWKDWTCGADFAEFATTVKLSQKEMQALVESMNRELSSTHEGTPTLQILDFSLLPATADTLRQDIGLSLYEMEMDVDRDVAQAAIEKFVTTDYVPLIMKEQTRQAGLVTIEVNAREHVEDLWLVKEGHKLFMRGLIRGKPSPYQVYAALFEKKSWIEAAQYPAVRIETFADADQDEISFFVPGCDKCGKTIPVNLLNKPFSQTHCPRCADEVEGRAVMKEAV